MIWFYLGLQSLATTEAAQSQSYEHIIIENTYNDLSSNTNWEVVGISITYWILVFYEARFFLMYAKRFLSVGFLIIISPLITMTYAIDKASDNIAQAYNTWFREMLVNVIIQPIHAIMYIIFLYTAGTIAQKAPILACLFLVALSRAEKIVKNVLDMRGMTSIHSMSESLKLPKK